jgi:hypothetical protein
MWISLRDKKDGLRHIFAYVFKNLAPQHIVVATVRNPLTLPNNE